MAFDKKYYKVIKLFIDEQLSGVSFLLLDQRPDLTPTEWATTFLPLLVDCQHREDYEGAKAIKDAIMEFLNQFAPADQKITEFDKLKLPEYRAILPTN